MTLDAKTIHEIHFPKKYLDSVASHCLRKLNGQYLGDETQEKQAYGLIGGKVFKDILLIEHIIVLNKNTREYAGISKQMDADVAEHAISGGMPVCKRGWIADPHEMMSALKDFYSEGLDLIGTYHMHHDNSWDGDEPRDEPTVLDGVLGKDTGLFMFIVGIVRQQKPIVRAFYEGKLSQEIVIREV